MKNTTKRNYRVKQGRYGYLFIAPFLVAFLVFGLYPVIYTVYLSFQKWDGLAAIKPIGWKNFIRLLSDKVFYLSLWNSLRIWIINFIPQMLTALILSAIFTFNKIKGMSFFRAAFYLPNLITAASIGLLFNLLFNGDKSVANYIFVGLKIPGAPFQFFNSEAFTSGLVSYIQWWMWFGYTTVIIMAGITTIDTNVYDAALVDGATKAQTYIHVTLARIDTEHRRNISTHFFSKLHGQVFILSTNEEINSDHVQIMKERIAATYTLENSDNKRTVVVQNAYFEV